MKNEKELREEMGAAFDAMKAISTKAETEKRELTAEELADHKAQYDKAVELKSKLQALLNEQEIDGVVNAKPVMPVVATTKAMTDKESEQLLKMETARILTAAASKSLSYDKKMEVIEDAQAKLKDAGHYRGASDGFSTLIDTDGGIFLPTSVSDMVYDIAKQYGVFAQFALRFPTGGGRLKIPNVMGDLEFQAVNEKSEILVDTFSFKGLELDDLKWALFVPWSNEVEGVRGAQLVSIIIRKLGEGLARKIDEVVIISDGTSTYHNIKGLIVRAADAASPFVRKSAAAGGRTSFGALEQDDWNGGKSEVAPSLRGRGIYIAHPDRMIELENKLFAATAANPVKWLTMVGEQMFINNRPIYFTEAFPNDDGADKPYAAFVDASYVAIADSGNFTTELFTEATIKTKTGGSVNLGSQDMKALRVKAFFDVELSPATTTVGATQKGAFSVLYTAAS
jgi:HK97 family phage major capsid protein